MSQISVIRLREALNDWELSNTRLRRAEGRIWRVLCVLLTLKLALALTGCTALDTVIDLAVQVPVRYCALSPEFKALARAEYRERLPEGYSLQVGCPVDE